ncbi:hypothetical protein ACFL6S_06800 [Candidatus Poribacteria bacterium]
MNVGKCFAASYMVSILLISFTFGAQAQISVHDTWVASGKLVLEDSDWSAVFSKEDGALLVYSRMAETIRIVPFNSEKAQTILSCEVIQNKYSGTSVRASFSNDQDQMEGSFFFDEKGAIEVEPAQGMRGIMVFGEISYGIVPAPPLEDLIYDPKKYPSASHVYLPSENLFLGLLAGEDRLFFCAWPDSDQRVKLLFRDSEKTGRAIEAVELQLDGKSAYLQVIASSGVWHEEELQRNYLGKDIAIDWQKPFSAKWKTQLLEGEIETNFHFEDWKRRTWRPNFGFYEYPVWFEGEQAFFHLGKRVPPDGQALVYALEKHGNTPVEFARQHIDPVPALEPKKGLQRYPSDNVGIQNCDGRAWLKWIFKMNLQAREKEFLHEVMDDFVYSINVDAKRLAEYEAFIPELKEKISQWIRKDEDPEVRFFLEQMRENVEELEKEYWNKMHDSPASEHLQDETEVIRELTALIEEEGLEIYPEVVHLLDRILLWSDIEAVPGRVGGLLREMFQQAGYGCAGDESLVEYAEQIRKDIRDFIVAGETHETIY